MSSVSANHSEAHKRFIEHKDELEQALFNIFMQYVEQHGSLPFFSNK